jgi:hypothetical protein
MRAQSAQTSAANRLPLAISCEAKRHMAAQSRSSRMHSLIMATFDSLRQLVAQWSQAVAQASQALMQEMSFSWGI